MYLKISLGLIILLASLNISFAQSSLIQKIAKERDKKGFYYTYTKTPDMYLRLSADVPPGSVDEKALSLSITNTMGISSDIQSLIITSEETATNPTISFMEDKKEGKNVYKIASYSDIVVYKDNKLMTFKASMIIFDTDKLSDFKEENLWIVLTGLYGTVDLGDVKTVLGEQAKGELIKKYKKDVLMTLNSIWKSFLAEFAKMPTGTRIDISKNREQINKAILKAGLTKQAHKADLIFLKNMENTIIVDNKKSNEQDFAEKLKNKTYGNMQDIVDFVRKNKDLELINIRDYQVMPYRPKQKPVIQINKEEIIIEIEGPADSWDLKSKITSSMEKPVKQKAKTPFILDDDGFLGADLHISDRAKTMFYYDGMLVVRHSNERRKRTQSDKDEGDFSKRPYINHQFTLIIAKGKVLPTGKLFLQDVFDAYVRMQPQYLD